MGPPELLPLEGQQSPIRIALGTKGFKLSCPVRTNSEKEWNEQQNNEEENELIIKWNKDQKPLEIIENGNFKLSNENRDLWILKAKVEDSGLFKCTAINEWGHQSVEFLTAPTWNEPIGPFPIQIRVNKGKYIQIDCPNAYGNPLPKLTWLKITGNSEQSQMSHLTFNQVNPKDAGIYSCHLENYLGAIRADFSLQIIEEEEESKEKLNEEDINLPSKGSISSSIVPSHIGSAVVNVIPPSTPKINLLNGKQQFNVGNIAELQCRVEWRGEKDKTVIRWLRQLDNNDVNALRAREPNSSVLKLGQITLLMIEQEDESAIRIEKSAIDGQKYFLNELRITNLQKEAIYENSLQNKKHKLDDSGRYFCVVTNPAGQFVYRSINLDVINSNSYIQSSYNLLNFYLSQSPFIRALILCFLGFLVIICILIIGWRFLLKNVQNNNSLSSSSSTSATATGTNNSNNTKISNIQLNSTNNTNNNNKIQFLTDIYNNSNFLPPPPRIPPPILPYSTNKQIIEWPSSLPLIMQQQQTSTLERYKIMRQPQLLHRTKADDEEMSKISSHIYASGSPLPLTINSRISNNKQYNFNKINNLYINKGQNFNNFIEEQRRPLIEAYRSTERIKKYFLTFI
ncbi:hypothetical protein Mgra_00009343 [Meloidogyne graminicola]|uniref:Ig-like domain-containing protein n=1 Tax=Meloidogyne graminicola TaxID=189291 RepID=A0A8S9ZD72_9BILA|nr:hypothetical protein Mgra_00009343 [Meloidogyne graminicola]